MNRLIYPMLLLTVCRMATAQIPLSGTKAYDYLQSQRQRADKVVGELPTPSPDSLRKADRILADALAYYDRPDVQLLAKTNASLFARKGDILFDKAAIQLRLGQTDAAAQSLTYGLAGEAASVYASYINAEPVFEPVRKHPLIAPLLKKAQAGSRLFNSDALKTPFQPNISDDEKLAGLSKLWSEAKYNFAYFDHVPDLDWDKLYLDYLPKMRATRSTAEYLYVLKSFCAHLHDGHTDVWANDPKLADLVSRRPPIRAMLVEGKALIQHVLQDSLMATGIRPLLELVSIDNLPVREYADRHVRPYVSASSGQNADVNTYSYDLLRGPKDKPVALVFRDKTGATFSRTLPRTGYANVRSMPAFSFRVLPGNVAYVQLNTFDSNEAQQRFRAAFDSIAATNALILDVRQNGGGNSGEGWAILGYLTDKPMLTGSYAARVYRPLQRARGVTGIAFEPTESTGEGWPANGTKHYTRPVVVLTGGQTFSAAEDFAVVFDAMKRGTIIGQPTGGSTGQPLAFALPGGAMARVCTKRDMYPDGTEWNGKGIQPNIVVTPTVADLQAGRDPVLAAALTHLGLGGAGTSVKRPKQK